MKSLLGFQKEKFRFLCIELIQTGVHLNIHIHVYLQHATYTCVLEMVRVVWTAFLPSHRLVYISSV